MNVKIEVFRTLQLHLVVFKCFFDNSLGQKIGFKKAGNSLFSRVVRDRRLELLQILPYRLLRPARLPISPPGQINSEF